MGGGRLREGLLALLLLLALSGCAAGAGPTATCTVLLEDDPALFFYRQSYEAPRDGDLTIPVGVPTGRRITGVNYGSYTVSAKTGYSASYDYYDLILHAVRYPALIRITTAPAGETVYHLADGPLTVPDQSPHLRPNTLPYQETLAREGYAAIGWNTAADGTGAHIGFGSRTDRAADGRLELYPQYLPASPEEDFTYALTDSGATVTAWSGRGDLVIPASLGGAPVTAIAAHAFGDVNAQVVVFPPSLERVEPGAFASLTAEHLYLFDALEEVGDASFGSLQVERLHLNAIRPPVYSGSYFHTFPDKMDYLRALAGEDKLILLCGSSARFGYNSPLLKAAFPPYEVVNMGVVAYANLLPQARMILPFVKEGDMILSSPELDAIQTQFCGETDLGQDAFCLTEGDYDLLSLLDCREFTGVFDAFSAYQAARATMAPRTYDESPAQFDEDGARVSETSYNIHGDYILYRENNRAGRCFGIKRAVYDPEAIRPQDWDGLNALYESFAAKGAEVYFTFSPRMSTSISPESTPEAVAALDAAVRERLSVPVISHAADSLMDPLWFFGTDNHLSTEGVLLFTQKVIDDLTAAREGTP